MTYTSSEICDFIGYAFGFWLLWRCFDWTYAFAKQKTPQLLSKVKTLKCPSLSTYMKCVVLLGIVIIAYSTWDAKDVTMIGGLIMFFGLLDLIGGGPWDRGR